MNYQSKPALISNILARSPLIVSWIIRRIGTAMAELLGERFSLILQWFVRL
jgi:hypothetical protein